MQVKTLAIFIFFFNSFSSARGDEDCDLSLSGKVRPVHKARITETTSLDAKNYQVKMTSDCNVPGSSQKYSVTDDSGKPASGTHVMESRQGGKIEHKFILPRYESDSRTLLRINVIEN